MKLKLALISALIYCSVTSAQSFSSGAFGAASLELTSVSSQTGIITGGRFGWIINKSIVIGGGYYALLNSIHANYKDQVSGDAPLLGFNYGGLQLEYVFFPDDRFHFSIDMLLAGGGLYFSFADDKKPHDNYFSQDLLVWEPSLNLEANTTDWLHIDLNFSYRFISSFDESYGLTKDDLKGFSAGLTFKFGSY